MAELQLPDASQWINSFNAGEQAGMTARKERTTQQVGGLMASGDYAGAARAAYGGGDLQTGAAIADAGYKQTERADKMARQQAIKAKLDVGDIAGAYDAAGTDPEAWETLGKVTEHAKETTAVMAGALQALKGPDGQWLPPDQARAKYAAMKPTLLQRGIDQQKLDSFDPTPENLQAQEGMVLGLAKQLELSAPKVVGDALVDPAGKVLYKGEKYLSFPTDQTVYATGGTGGNGASTTGQPPANGGDLPRGLRNNNPLNVTSLPHGQWDGQTGADGHYATFSTPEAGWTAADKNLQSYATQHGINTLSGVIGRWAPKSENDTAAYTATVAKALGVDPNAQLNLADPGVRRKVLEAMAGVENGQPVGYGSGAPAAAPAAADQGGLRIVAQGKPKETVRPATAEEKAAYGIPADVPAKIGPNGIDVISGTGANLKRIPPAIQGGYVSNNQAMANIDAAIAAIRANPGALGLKNKLGDDVNQRIDPNGVPTRAAVANIGSQILHDRSGAAVTAAETPRLMPFIPTVSDTPEAAIKKLEGLKSQYHNANTEIEVAYGPDSGYAPLGGGRGDQGGGASKPKGWSSALTPQQRETAMKFKNATGPGGSQGNPFAPVSEAEFEKLAPGAWFINPADGKVRQKTH